MNRLAGLLEEPRATAGPAVSPARTVGEPLPKQNRLAGLLNESSGGNRLAGLLELSAEPTETILKGAPQVDITRKVEKERPGAFGALTRTMEPPEIAGQSQKPIRLSDISQEAIPVEQPQESLVGPRYQRTPAGTEIIEDTAFPAIQPNILKAAQGVMAGTPPPEPLKDVRLAPPLKPKAPWLMKQIAGGNIERAVKALGAVGNLVAGGVTAATGAVTSINEFTGKIGEGEDEAQAIMKANLFRRKPEIAAKYQSDPGMKYMMDNPQDSFIPSIFNLKLGQDRILEVDKLAAMPREGRKKYFTAKGKVNTAQFFGKEKDLREYMLFSGVLKDLKSREFKDALERLQKNAYPQSPIYGGGPSPDKVKDQLVVRDKLLKLEEMQDRGVGLPAEILDSIANMGKYAGEIYLMGGLRPTTQLGKVGVAGKMAVTNVGELMNLVTERMTPKGYLGDKGEFIQTEKGQSIAMVLPKSLLEQTVTYWTEQQGEAIFNRLKGMNTWLMKKMPKGVASTIMKSRRLTEPFYAAMRKGELDGMLPEIAEEYINRVMIPVLRLDDQYRDKDQTYLKGVAKSLIPDPRELIVQVATFGLLPVAGHLTGLAARGRGEQPPVSASKPPTVPAVSPQTPIVSGIGAPEARTQVIPAVTAQAIEKPSVVPAAGQTGETGIAGPQGTELAEVGAEGTAVTITGWRDTEQKGRYGTFYQSVPPQLHGPKMPVQKDVVFNNPLSIGGKGIGSRFTAIEQIFGKDSKEYETLLELAKRDFSTNELVKLTPERLSAFLENPAAFPGWASNTTYDYADRVLVNKAKELKYDGIIYKDNDEFVDVRESRLAQPAPAAEAPVVSAVETKQAERKAEIESGQINTIAGKMDLTEFERMGYDTSEVTQSDWVTLQRAERRRLGQREGGDNPRATWVEYEEFHKDAVKRAIEAGDEVDDRVLEPYKSEPWAQEALAKAKAKPPVVTKPKAETPEQKPEGVKREPETAEEAIVEPKPSAEVQPGQAGPVVPTGTLDPAKPEDALKIIELHQQFLRSGRDAHAAVGGIFTTKFDEKTREFVVDTIEYTHQQVDAAYRTVQTAVPSGQAGVNLWAMPGKEKDMVALAAKMARMKALAATKPSVPSLPRPHNLPAASKLRERHVKAVYGAADKAKEEPSRYAIAGVLVEGENLVATDGRRMFVAKGKWGKDGVYLDTKALRNGLLGKANTNEKIIFPRWKDIVPDYEGKDAIWIYDKPPNGINSMEDVWRRVQQARLLKGELPGVMVILNKDGSLGFAAGSPEVGHAEIHVLEGGKILGAVNADFLLDALAFHAIRGDKSIEFYFPSPERVIWMRGAQTQSLTMPVNPGAPSEELKQALGIVTEKKVEKASKESKSHWQETYEKAERLYRRQTATWVDEAQNLLESLSTDDLKALDDARIAKGDLDTVVRQELATRAIKAKEVAAPAPETEKKGEALTKAEKDALRAKGFSVGDILKMTPEDARGKLKEEKPKGTSAIGTISAGGMKVAMEPKGKIQTAGEIISYIGRAFNIPLRGKATFHKAALGWFDPKAVGIRMKDVRQLTTAMHEIGHHIDWTLNKRLSLNPPNADMATELLAMGKALYGTRKPTGGYKSEGWAEFMREYLTGDEAQTKAPAVYKWFTEEYLPGHPEVNQKLNKTKQMITTWRIQGAESRIESQIVRKELKGTLGERFSHAMLWLEKSFRGEAWLIKRLMQRAGIEEGKLKPSDDPFLVYRARSKAANEVATDMVLEHTTDLAGNVTGKGLREVLSAIPKSQIKAFTRWMYAAEARLMHSKGQNPGISKADADYVYEKYDNPQWKETLKEVTDWNRRVLHYLVEAGGLTEEIEQVIIAANPIYIPMMRAFYEDEIATGRGGTGAGIAGTPKVIKKRKGSGREIIDPLISMIQQVTKIVNAAHKTQVALAFAKLAKTQKGLAGVIWKVPAPMQATTFQAEQLKKDIAKLVQERMGLGPAETAAMMSEHWDDLLTVYTNANQYYGKDNIVSFVIDGKREFYEVDPELYKAIQGIDRYKLHWLVDLTFGKLNRSVRLGATGLNASFGLIRNFLRDAMTFTIQAKHAKFGPASAVAGVVKDVMGTEGARRFKSLGGKMSIQVLADRRAYRHLRTHVLKNTAGDKVIYTVAHPIDAMRELFGLTEAGVRIAEFDAALKYGEKKWGKDSLDAAMYAIVQGKDVTTDFTMIGSIGKILNEIIPFFNSAIQGPDKMIRTFREHKVATALRVFVYLTLPALWLWWKSKDEEWYKNMPIYERANYLHFPIPGTKKIVRIPVPFELGYIFQSLPVAALDSWYRKDPKLVTDTFVETLKRSNPFDWPAAIGPIVSILKNKDFAGRPIVPKGAENKLSEDQYARYTSELMKRIGATIGFSPAKLEYLVNSYSGGLYARVSRTVDLMKKEDITASDIPVLGTLFMREPYAPKMQLDRFFETRDELRRKSASKKITPQENQLRLKYNHYGDSIVDEMKKAGEAKTEAERIRIYAKIKNYLNIVQGQQQTPAAKAAATPAPQGGMTSAEILKLIREQQQK